MRPEEKDRRPLDQYLAANDSVERDVQKKAGEDGRYWRRAFGMSIRKPIVQGRETDLGPISNQKKDERRVLDSRFQMSLHGIEVGPQQRSHAFMPKRLLGGKI
jgi:hypothetical protein